jgi:glycosyltransferase involved in cell wall biosynthesis
MNLEGSMGGAENSLLLLAESISKIQSDFCVSIACPKPSLLSEKLGKLNIDVFNISPPPAKFNLKLIWGLYFLRANFQLLLLIIKIRPEIIHANTTKSLLASALATLFTNKKLIWHVRDVPRNRFIIKLCNIFADRIIAVSNFIKNELIKFDISPKKITVIYNGISPDSFSCVESQDYEKVITFANIGQLVPWKRQDFFVDAAQKFLFRNNQVQFLIIGDDIFNRDTAYKQHLLSKIHNSPYKDNIKLIPWQNDLVPMWNEISCLVHTAKSEPFGRIIIEAMAHRIPVIASNAGGPAEIIQHNITGLLFEQDDVDDLLDKMQMICRDHNLAERLKNDGSKYVLSHLQAIDCFNKILLIYTELLAVQKCE